MDHTKNKSRSVPEYNQIPIFSTKKKCFVEGQKQPREMRISAAEEHI